MKKLKKIPLWLHFRRKKVGKGGEREKIKIIVLFRSYPTRKNKLQQNRKNIQKIKIYHYDFISSKNRLEKTEKEKK